MFRKFQQTLCLFGECVKFFCMCCLNAWLNEVSVMMISILKTHFARFQSMIVKKFHSYLLHYPILMAFPNRFRYCHHSICCNYVYFYFIAIPYVYVICYSLFFRCSSQFVLFVHLVCQLITLLHTHTHTHATAQRRKKITFKEIDEKLKSFFCYLNFTNKIHDANEII